MQISRHRRADAMGLIFSDLLSPRGEFFLITRQYLPIGENISPRRHDARRFLSEAYLLIRLRPNLQAGSESGVYYV